jgi:ribonuclease HI
MIKVYTDGGARGNPGPGAIGIVIYKNGVKIKEEREFLGVSTNNQAEYKALIKGLEIGIKISNKAECYIDSELVVKQLNGEYRVKDEKLIKLNKKVREKEKMFKSVKYIHVNRTNKRIQEADRLVNLCLNKNS